MPQLSSPVPPVTTGPVTEDHLPVLLWVHTGTARVDAAGVSHAVRAGQAIWVPPGVEHCTTTDPGGVVLPVFPSAPTAGLDLDSVRVVAVPGGWEDWLVARFDFNRHHTRGEVGGDSDLIALVTQGAPTHDAEPVVVPPLPMPSSPEARDVADEFLRAPQSDRVAEDLAAGRHVSVRTLQRQFRNETGLTLSAWRTRARVVVAASLLDAGHDVGWTGRRVGFETPAGFTRAFRRHVGVPPRLYARREAVALGAAADPVGTVTGPPRETPRIPPRQVWSWVFDRHVLWWAYRGEVAIRIGPREVILQRGQALWLPAGFSASVDDLADGSILLPLGSRSGGADVAPADLVVHDLTHASTAMLLGTVLTEYTLFRPMDEREDTETMVDLMFRAQFAEGASSSAPSGATGAVARIAAALRRDPADPASLADWARRLGASGARIGREFRQQTGRSFPRWRAELRMSLARELLRDGTAPRDVSRRLGYASTSAFGQVFSTAHGVTPRQYQLRVARQRVIDGSDRPDQARSAIRG